MDKPIVTTNRHALEMAFERLRPTSLKIYATGRDGERELLQNVILRTSKPNPVCCEICRLRDLPKQ